MRNGIILILVIALAGAVSIQVTSVASSPDTEGQIVELAKRVEKLESAVRLLASEVDKIKGRMSATQLTKSGVSLQNLAEIRKILVRGTHKEVIRQALGEPLRIELSSSIESWYYPDNRSITFYNDELYGHSGF